MPIIRKKLTSDELTPANLRYNPTTDQMEVTLDGGATWNPDPNSDPRINPALILPVAGTECPRAGGMIAAIQAMVDQISTITTLGAFATNLLAYVLLWSVIATPVAVALAVADTVILYGSTVLVGAMTPTVYDQLLCIFNCYMPDDGIITDEVWNEIRTAIGDEIGSGDVNTVVDLWRTLVGTTGITNAATVGNDVGTDCSACDECRQGCYHWNFRDGADIWFLRAPEEGNIVPGVGWTQNCANIGGAANRVVIQMNLPDPTTIVMTKITVWADYVRGGLDGGAPESRQLLVRSFDGYNGTGSQLQRSDADSIPVPTGHYEFGIDPVVSDPVCIEVNAWSSNGICNGSVVITDVEVEYTGADVFGDPNCIPTG